MILTDEKSLRIKCEDVSPEEVDRLRCLLEKELIESSKQNKPGIGLAASQIGIPKKIAIIRYKNYSLNLVNAKIVNKFDKIKVKEGCLSFPGEIIETNRYNEIHVLNDVEPKSFIARGFLSVVIQHENDHNNGILMLDRKIKNIDISTTNNKIRPNDICPCGSHKKYKKCCGEKL